MTETVRILALLVAGFASLAPAASAAPAVDSWAALHRPLKLALAAGEACPVSPSRKVDGGRISGALGAGPVYPLSSRFDRDDRHPGLLAAKTLWTWPTGLISHPLRVLVRARRLDGPGAMRFQLGPQWDTAPLSGELRLDTSNTVGAFSASKWGTTVTLLYAPAPGCYGLQLDSRRGTSTIVIETTAR
jgi:hypothetical protein